MQNIETDATTNHGVFAIPMEEEGSMEEFDHSPNSCTVFDDVGMGGYMY